MEAFLVRLRPHPGPSPPATGAREPLKVVGVPRNFCVVLLSSFKRPIPLAPCLALPYRLYPCCSLPCRCLLPAPLRPADDQLPAAPLDCPAPHPSSRFRGRASYRACQLRVKLFPADLRRCCSSLPAAAAPRFRHPDVASPQGSGFLANSTGAVNQAAAASGAPRDTRGRPPCCAGPRRPLASPPSPARTIACRCGGTPRTRPP